VHLVDDRGWELLGVEEARIAERRVGVFRRRSGCRAFAPVGTRWVVRAKPAELVERPLGQFTVGEVEDPLRPEQVRDLQLDDFVVSWGSPTGHRELVAAPATTGDRRCLATCVAAVAAAA